MSVTYPRSQKISDEALNKLLDEIKTAKPLPLNKLIPEAQLNAIANGDAPPAGIASVSELVTGVGQHHWYKLQPNQAPGTEFEFRTLFRRPSTLPVEELLVHIFAQNSAGQFLTSHGGPIGSSVAHGTSGSSLGISRRAFIGSGTFPTYYFRIVLIGNGTPPANPYLFLAYKVTT